MDWTELARIGPLVVTAATLGFWLSQRFSRTEARLEKLLDHHEDKDQHRHEDNIQRFAVLETKLNTVLLNGKH